MKEAVMGVFAATAILFSSVVSSYQSSESVSIQLGVRNPYPEVDSYRAVFVVMDSQNKKYSKEIKISGDEFGYVKFPEDFNTFSDNGNYKWKALINNEVVVDGEFTISNYSVLTIKR